MNSSRFNRRSTVGRFAPLAVLTVAAGFSAVACLHAGEPVWLKMGPIGRMFVSGVLVFAAAAIELLVLRQKKFVERGVATSVIIDDVRPLPWSATHCAVQYHFFTEDRRVISACCAIEATERSQWVKGTRRTAIYDAARPARHALSDHKLWAIRWTPEEEADASFDEAISAMIAIAPARAA